MATGHNTDLTRVTVNLTPKSIAALHSVTALTGERKTDALNRAIQLYDYLKKLEQSSGSVCVSDATGKLSTLALL